MQKIKDLNLYRVYGERGLDSFDEYVHGSSPQHAVDRVREWYGNDPDVKILEVAKVMKSWK